MEVKLGDFGFSRSFSPGKAMETACGSLTYAAPEVIAGKVPKTIHFYNCPFSMINDQSIVSNH